MKPQYKMKVQKSKVKYDRKHKATTYYGEEDKEAKIQQDIPKEI